MAEYTKLSFSQGELNATLAGWLQSLLDKAVIDAVLAPADQGNGRVMQTLITDPAQTTAADLFAPMVPINSAKLVSGLTATPSGRPVAAVLRACEVRALVELVKLKQASVDDLVVIGLDCLGRYENADYLAWREAGGTSETFLAGALAGTTAQHDVDITAACRACETPAADNVDIRLCVVGAGEGEVYIEWCSDKGRAVRDKLGLEGGDAPAERDAALAKLTESRTAVRDKAFAAFREATGDFQKLQDHLAGCINCYNCRVACPVCYCKECVFVTDTFRHAGDQFMGWADKRGALKMPTDTMFYHLTRLTHMSTLCVGCGQCTSACPNDIDLMPLFRTVSDKTQARFEYVAGRSLDEPQPLAVFHDDEMVEVTGQVK